MAYQQIRVEPVSAYVGADIDGIDLNRPIPAETFAEIRRAFGERTRCGRNSPAASTGAKGRWHSGTTPRPGTSRSTTITASVGSCTASRSRARD
jgi:hypothetical protein